MHHGLLSIGGAKMGKSLGNALDLAYVDSLGVRPVELRYYYAAAHYRSRIDYSEDALREAAVAYRRIEGFVQRAAERVGAGAARRAAGRVRRRDGRRPQHLGRARRAARRTLRDGNTALTVGDDVTVRTTLAAVRAMLDILGVDPLDPAWTGGGRTGDLRGVVDSLVALALEQRAQARGRKDWAAADAVRDQLKQAGVVVEDTPQGPRWTIGEQD